MKPAQAAAPTAVENIKIASIRPATTKHERPARNANLAIRLCVLTGSLTIMVHRVSQMSRLCHPQGIRCARFQSFFGTPASHARDGGER